MTYCVTKNEFQILGYQHSNLHSLIQQVAFGLKDTHTHTHKHTHTGLMLGQNCTRLPDAAPDNFFFFWKFILSKTV